MKTIAVIIDYDNYFGTDMSTISSEKLEFSFSEIVNLCEAKFLDFDNILIRLYGGWYRETTLTKQASVLQQLLYNVRVFPKVQGGKAIQGSIEIISELHGIPDHTWGFTHKETDGIRPVRIDFNCVDELCTTNRTNCPKFILNKFTKSKDKVCAVQGCTNIQKNIFKGIEQKMVDTIIACDILSISDDETIKGLILISDDQDHFPSLALAKQNQKNKKIKNLDNIFLGIRNEKKIDFISEFLRPFQIQTTLVQ